MSAGSNSWVNEQIKNKCILKGMGKERHVRIPNTIIMDSEKKLWEWITDRDQACVPSQNMSLIIPTGTGWSTLVSPGKRYLCYILVTDLL